jgi:glucokinase
MLLGIDIGGTTISLGLVEGSQIVKQNRVPSFQKDATLEETIDYLCGQIEEIITPAVTSIGIGVPTLVDVKKGIVYDAANIQSWKKVPLKEILEKRFRVPVSVNNDANCFALGAAARLDISPDVMVGVTLGTGTGIGIIAGGKLVCGDNCGAGEIGSVPYNGKDFESFCSKKFFTSRGWNPREVALAAETGRQDALEFFDDFGKHIGELMSLVMYSYDPGCVVFGGGIANTYPFFQKSMERALRKRYPYKHALDRLEIRTMPQEEIALLGASLL